MKSFATIIQQTKEETGGLLEAFHAIQAEYHYLPSQAISQIAQTFDMPTAKVYETASFYSYLNLKPVGENIIRICESAPCHVAGAGEVVAELEKLLHIKMGETTPDGEFTLKFGECVGQCQASSVITVNQKVYCNVTPHSLLEILSQYQGGQEG